MQVGLPEKLKAFVEPARYKVAYGGRGGAKSWNIARMLLIAGAERPLRILCAREIQRTISDSVHQLLKDQIGHLSLEAFYKVTESEIVGKNGTQFLFAGLRQQDVAKIKSLEGVDICWVEEAQVVSKRSWDILIPTIRKEGSEIWVSFNPELDTDETYRRFVLKPPPTAKVVQIGWRDNYWFPDVLKQEMEHLKASDEEAYRHVWEGECRATVEGAIYKREIEDLYKEPRRVRPVPHDPMLKVHTVWDLGWNDQTSIILVQRLLSEVRVIEYIEDSHRTIAEYIAELKERKYNWGIDFLPHDGAHADIKTGTSVQAIVQKLGRNAHIVPKLDVEQGIKIARTVFPRVYFDEDRALELVNRLKRYRRHQNQATGEFVQPLHDENSHGADAFRYLAQSVDRMSNETFNTQKLNYPNLGHV